MQENRLSSIYVALENNSGGSTAASRLHPHLPNEYHLQTRGKRTCLSTTAGSKASPSEPAGPRNTAEASPPPPAPRCRARGPPSGRRAVRAEARRGRAGRGSLAKAEPRVRLPSRSLQVPGPSYAEAAGAAARSRAVSPR